MRKLVLFASLVFGLFAMPVLANAAQGFATANVNLRSGPSTAYPPVTVIPVGAPVTIFGCLSDSPWCDTSYAGIRGWVSGNYLQTVYQDQRVYVGPEYYAPLGIPIIAFSFDSYWDRYYRDRPFYRDRDRWHDYYVNRPHRPPGYRPPPHRPPDYRPPGQRPPHVRPPGNRPEAGRPPNQRPPHVRPPGNRPEAGRPPNQRPPHVRPPGNRPEAGRPNQRPPQGANRPNRPPQGANRPNRPPQGANRPNRPPQGQPPPRPRPNVPCRPGASC